MQAFESAIIRVTSGLLNTVNDEVIAGQAGTSGQSKFAGQLGKMLAVSQEQIGLMFDPGVGTLYAGVYQYVQLSPTLGTPQPEIGQALFWDRSAAVGSYIVNDVPGLTAPGQAAGVYIGGAEAGNYGFIQVAGLCNVRFVHTLSAGASTGQGLTVTAAGLFDNPAPVNPIYAAYAIQLPVIDTIKLAQLAGFLSMHG